MVNFAFIFVPVLILFFLLRLMTLPIKWGLKLILNTVCGFFCLWILNSLAEFTGVFFPVNYPSALIVGFLGLPGIALLLLVRVLL